MICIMISSIELYTFISNFMTLYFDDVFKVLKELEQKMKIAFSSFECESTERVLFLLMLVMQC